MYEALIDSQYITSCEVDFYKEFNNRFPNSEAYRDVKELLDYFGGCNIMKGLFRFHTLGSSVIWNQFINGYFKGNSNQFCCFGYDWMGRHFALSNDDSSIIYMFDQATWEVFEQRSTLSDFIKNHVIECKFETLNKTGFEYMSSINVEDLPLSHCFGFKLPLYLSGKDEISNYQLIDMEVDWEIGFQLYNKVRDLPEGTIIDNVSID